MRPGDYQPVKVLALSTAEPDHNCLQHILDHTSWNLWRSRNIADAVATVQQHRIPVVLTCENLPDGDWKALLVQLQCLPEPPEVIVMTSKADDRVWTDFLTAGAYDIIQRPFDRTEVFRIVSLAWRQWQSCWSRATSVRSAQRATA